jgi:hypothetical protein
LITNAKPETIRVLPLKKQNYRQGVVRKVKRGSPKVLDALLLNTKLATLQVMVVVILILETEIANKLPDHFGKQ